jgi:hypothetical protein
MRVQMNRSLLFSVLVTVRGQGVVGSAAKIY